MRRDEWEIPTPHGGFVGRAIAYGHWGHPVLYFPCEGGSARDMEDHGIIHALAPAIEAGRIKVYAVDANDHWSWSNRSIPTEERARRHVEYERWITEGIVPAIHSDCGSAVAITAAGASMGAFHAVNTALRRADLFPRAVGMSGNYDPASWNGWGEAGDTLYFTNPSSYVPNLGGEHLDWLRGRLFVQLVVGSGAFEVEGTQALPSSRALAQALWDKGIPCALDVWGEDTPHDWPSWQRMAVKHLAGL